MPAAIYLKDVVYKMSGLLFKMKTLDVHVVALTLAVLLVFGLANTFGETKSEDKKAQSTGNEKANSNKKKSTNVNSLANRAGKKKEKANRLREGTRIVNRLGYFKVSGEGMIFYSSDGELEFPGLENLALERVARVIENVPRRSEWSVTGTITEFRENNFLFITRAVLKGSAGKKSSNSSRN